MSGCGRRLNPGPDWHCKLCPELVKNRTQVVTPTPCPPGGLLVIGEAPGAEEDALGEGFVGRAGVVLDELLARHGLERNRDYGVANVVRCRPPGNRKPKPYEISRCLPWLATAIVEYRPSVLLLVGGTAASVFMGDAPLYAHVEKSRVNALPTPENAHPEVAGALGNMRGLNIVPMPHTSGMAWNRRAPDGRHWKDIGVEQIKLAVYKLLQSRRTRGGRHAHGV